MEDYIKCERIGGGSLAHLNTFSNLSIVAVHYTLIKHVMYCCIVDSTHVHHAVYYKLLLTALMQGQLQLASEDLVTLYIRTQQQILQSKK